ISGSCCIGLPGEKDVGSFWVQIKGKSTGACICGVGTQFKQAPISAGTGAAVPGRQEPEPNRTVVADYICRGAVRLDFWVLKQCAAAGDLHRIALPTGHALYAGGFLGGGAIKRGPIVRVVEVERVQH